MIRYSLFKKAKDNLLSKEDLKMTKINKHMFNKFIKSGDLAREHFDYDRGYYDVSIYYFFDRGKHFCRVWFGTIDDGDFGSWNKCNTKKAALELVIAVKNRFSSINICPSQKELNSIFKDLGVQFKHE
jgi:hypothetical protein